RAEIQSLLQTVTSSSDKTRGWVSANQNNIIRLSTDSREFLTMLARYSPEVPCLSRAMTEQIPLMDRVLGKGTNEPGLHAEISVVPSRGKYVSGRDSIRYSSGSGPSCPGSGDANSPSENRLIAELMST